MPPPRAAVIALCLSAAVLVTSCGASGTVAGSSAPTTTEVTAGVEWADEVCSASTALQDAVREAQEATEADPTSSETSLEQARDQAREKVTAVQESATALGAALADLPAGGDTGLADAQQELQAASQRAQDAVDQLGVVVAQVSDAETAAEATVGLGGLRVALAATLEDLGRYLETLGATVDDGAQAVQDTFEAAPACAALTP